MVSPSSGSMRDRLVCFVVWGCVSCIILAEFSKTFDARSVNVPFVRGSRSMWLPLLIWLLCQFPDEKHEFETQEYCKWPPFWISSASWDDKAVGNMQKSDVNMCNGQKIYEKVVDPELNISALLAPNCNTTHCPTTMGRDCYQCM